MADPNSTCRRRNFKDLTNQQFGKWTVLHEVPHPKSGAHWLCRCECGVERVVRGDGLRNGSSRQCDHCKNRSHGMESTLEYGIWANILYRCNTPSAQAYESYGGRGIRVCERWRSFENFLTDMGRRPSTRHSVHRINNDGDYTPENCKWATPTEQARNTRRSRLLTFNGETRCLSEWAELVGIGWTTLDERLRRGMSVEQVLTTPLNHKNSHPRSKQPAQSCAS